MLSLTTIIYNLNASDLWFIDDSLTLWHERTIDKVRMVVRVCANRECANYGRARPSRDPKTPQHCPSQCVLNAWESVLKVHTLYPTF